MREFEVSSHIAAPLAVAWEVLERVPGWPEWSMLFPRAEGALVPGAVLDLDKREPGGEPTPFAPRVVSVDAGSGFVLEATFGATGALCLSHEFRLEPLDPSSCALKQRWFTETPLDDAKWSAICAGMARFAAFGEELADRAAAVQAVGVDSR